MRRLLSIFLCGLLLAVGSVGFASAQDPLDQTCDTVDARTSSATCDARTTDNPLTGPNGLLEKITNIVAIVAGFAAVIMIMVGGFRYITANGDSQSATNARKTVLAAIIGLIIIVAARSLIVFVLRRIT